MPWATGRPAARAPRVARPDADFAAVRALEYPDADEAIYMSAASFGAMPERSLRAMEAFNRLRQAPHRLDHGVLFDALDRSRQALAPLIGADPATIGLAPNTSAGINLAAALLRADAARGAPWLDGRRALVFSEGEFPTNAYPWIAMGRDGWDVRRVPTDPLGRPREEALLEALTDDVAAFALSAVQFSSGFRARLDRFGAACQERGILFVVDAIQAVGALPLDAPAAGIDILACGGQKWLCGPYGSGFIHVRAERIPELDPPFPGWLSFASTQAFVRFTEYRYDLVENGRRFEQGSLGIQDHVGLAHSAELLGELGTEAVWDHIQAVQAPLLDWVLDRDDVVLTSDPRAEHRSGIVALKVPDTTGAHARLREAGIHCMVREGALRFAPHFYNTTAEMERVVEVLDAWLCR